MIERRISSVRKRTLDLFLLKERPLHDRVMRSPGKKSAGPRSDRLPPGRHMHLGVELYQLRRRPLALTIESD